MTDRRVKTTSQERARRAGAGNGTSHRALSGGPETQRLHAAAPSLAGTFRLHQRRRRALDRGQARSATDQHSRVGHVLSDVSPGARGEEAHPRLPHAELRDGGQLPVEGETLRRLPASIPSAATTACTIPSPSGQMANTASSSSNASPVAAPRRSAWWTMICTKTSRPIAAAALLAQSRPASGTPTSPHPLEQRLIFKNIGRGDWTPDIDCYLRHGGYEQLKKARSRCRAPTSSTKSKPPACAAAAARVSRAA